MTGDPDFDGGFDPTATAEAIIRPAFVEHWQDQNLLAKRFRRKRMVALFAQANGVARGAGILGPPVLVTPPRPPDAADSQSLIDWITRGIKENMNREIAALNGVRIVAGADRPFSNRRERDRNIAAAEFEHQQRGEAEDRLRAAAAELCAIVARLAVQATSAAVWAWYEDHGSYIGRIAAVAATGQAPRALIGLREPGGGPVVLLPYDSPDRLLAVIAKAVNTKASASQVLTTYRTEAESALPAEAARLPEFAAYGIAMRNRESVPIPWAGLDDDYVARYDPMAAPSRLPRRTDE
jgi:hypothetical protein